MEINSTGATKSELVDYLGFWQTKLKEVYGDDFTIRKEGIVDNLATSGSLLCMLIEDVLMYLIKNKNPQTAEGEWQDQLYSIVGLERKYADYTKVTRTIEGTANLACPVGSIRFKNSATDDIFELNTAVTLNAQGKATGSFTAIELGAIELDNSALLEIIDAPDGVVGVYYSTGDVTNIGDDYEDDSEFRARWLATNSVKGGNTEGGMYAALLPLCDYSKNNLVIRQNRTVQTYLDFPLHTMAIVLKSAESNETIANTIFNNLMDGVGLYGDIDITVKDDSNENVTISFSRAVDVAIYFKVEVVLKEGFLFVQVVDSIKQAIVDNFDYAMGERIIANDFYQYINVIDGIDYVTLLQVSDDNSNWEQTIAVNYNEYGTVDIGDITASEAE